MTETIAFENVYMCYIKNEPYKYPSIDVDIMVEGTTAPWEYIDTGWHIIPNFLWRHCVIPRQWASLVTNCEAYALKAVEGVIYNPIPITTNIAIQRTNLFSAFNNCTYALTYDDNKYETNWFRWNDLTRQRQLHLSQREGIIWYGTQQVTGDSNNQTHEYYPTRYHWPIFGWQRPQMRTVINDVWSQGKIGQAGVFDCDTSTQDTTTGILGHRHALPGGIFWDPFNCPDEIGELRAGKNSISFRYEAPDEDKGKFFNLDVMANYGQWSTDGPFCGVDRPGTWKQTTACDPDTATTFGLAEKQGTASGGNVTPYDDYTIPNFANLPLAPTKWFWHEVGKSICDSMEENEPASNAGHTQFKDWRKINKYYPGTELESCKYPPSQWFCKGIPLWDANNALIQTTTQVSFKIKLIVEGKKRRSAYYAPTHGPWSGDQLYLHTNKRCILQPAAIRYKTGGIRRTWQNINTLLKVGNTSQDNDRNAQNFKIHPRQDIYLWKTGLTDKNQLMYDPRHRPAGINDSLAESYQDIAGRQHKQGDASNIVVTWSRDTDKTEIHMMEK
nr:capsid protein VP1 [Chaphamaparvovirus anseriform 7]